MKNNKLHTALVTCFFIALAALGIQLVLLGIFIAGKL